MGPHSRELEAKLSVVASDMKFCLVLCIVADIWESPSAAKKFLSCSKVLWALVLSELTLRIGKKKITFPPGKSVLCLTVDKNILKLLDFIGFSKTLNAFLSNWNIEEPCACSPDFFAWNYWIIYLYDESLQIEIHLVPINTIIVKTLYNRRIQETTIDSPVWNVYQKCPMLTKRFGCIYPWNQSLPYVLP